MPVLVEFGRGSARSSGTDATRCLRAPRGVSRDDRVRRKRRRSAASRRATIGQRSTPRSSTALVPRGAARESRRHRRGRQAGGSQPSLPIDVWVDADGRVRKLSIDARRRAARLAVSRSRPRSSSRSTTTASRSSSSYRRADQIAERGDADAEALVERSAPAEASPGPGATRPLGARFRPVLPLRHTREYDTAHARIEAFIRTPRSDRARRRRHLPRLRRRRLDLPLARPARARLRRRARPRRTTASAAPSPTRTPTSAATMLGAASSRGRARVEPEAALRDLRYAATDGRGLRATGHTASDQVETVLYRHRRRRHDAGDQGAARGRRRAAAARRSAREETRAYCARARPAVSRGLVEPGDEARADPGRDPAAARAARIPAPTRTSCALARRAAAPAARARGDARRAARVARRARRPRTSAAASARCASTARCGSRARRVGAVDDRVGARRPRGAHAPPGRPSRGPPQEGAGSARGREGAEGGARRLAARRPRRRGRRRPGRRGRRPGGTESSTHGGLGDRGRRRASARS